MVRSSTGDRRVRNSRSRRSRILIGVLVVLALLVGLNAFVLERETGKARLDQPGAKLIVTTSGPLQVLDTGPPPGGGEGGLPLVLIHGSGGAIDWWESLLPQLRPERRVIALDLLGYGGSAKPDSGYSIETQAGLVAQVLDRIGISRTVAVGHSLGGAVATALAQQSPGLVAGVVLLDSAPNQESGGLNLTAKAAMAPIVGPLLWRLAPDAMRRRGLAQAFAPGTEVPSQFVEDLKAMTYPAYRDSGRELARFVRESSLADRLQASGLPLLVIFGEEDQIYPARESLSAYAGIPGVKTVLITGSGHSPQVEAPEKTAAEILTFATGIDEAAAARARAVELRKQRRARAARKAVIRARKARADRKRREQRRKSKSGKKSGGVGSDQGRKGG